ncbi:MAG: SMP-30/gluconolactonase/LRE family protein [Paenibacillaceae bacterium]
MITLHAECVIAGKNMLGEGPVWDEKLNELFWVDIDGRKLHRYRPSDGKTAEYSFEQKIGCALPAEDGSWVVALEDGFYRFDLDSGSSLLIVHTQDANLKNRLNDGKCDPTGRIWAGTMSSKWQRDGNLYTLEANDKFTLRLPGVVCSNGLAWNAEATTMYYIDSFERIVHAFDYDAATGNISNQRAAITYPEGEAGGPDGMSIDSEGMLWIGHWGGWQVGRWNPHTGEKLATVKLPVNNVTSCAFGGEHLDELYITTSITGNDGNDMNEQPLAGGLFRVKLDVKGLPVQRAKR